MHLSISKASRLIPGLAASLLLLGSHAAIAQTVNLTAAPTSTTLPDGQNVPMWGFQCGAPDTSATPATCAAANPAVQAVFTRNSTWPSWSPVVITVPYSSTGTSLAIYLTNNLAFTAGTTTNAIPTSLVIVGQLGGGLEQTIGSAGTHHTTTASPVHSGQGITWPTADPTTTSTPPAQLPRVQSFGTEVAATLSTAAQTPTKLTWSNLRPGTYLIESGTHPSIQAPMGLYGILVVTAPGKAYPDATSNPLATTMASTYDADLPVVLGEIDPVQNDAVDAAVRTAGFSETAVWSALAGPGPVTGLTVTNGGAGYTSAPTVILSGGGGSGATATASVSGGVITSLTVVNPGSGYTTPPSVSFSGGAPTTGASATANVNAGCGNSSNPTFNTCYPPAVNYSPRYYLVNGVSFDRTSLAGSTFPVLAPVAPAATVAPVSGNVLVRLVNAGLRMHVPSIVNLPMTLIAEDGNPLPGATRIQNEVFLAAGKTYDVVVTPAQAAGVYTQATYPLFDRQLSLSTNNQRDGGMQAYIAVSGGATSGVGTTASATTLTGVSTGKQYFCVAGTTLSVTDPSLGLLGGTTGANGVTLTSTTVPGTLNVQSNGTFIYTPPAAPAACGGSLTYLVNTTSVTSTITECDASNSSSPPPGCTVSGAPKLANDSYTGTNAKLLTINPPGVLLNDIDPSGRPLTVDVGPGKIIQTSGPGTLQLLVNPDGSFSAQAPQAGTYTFTYNVKNSQGTAAQYLVDGTTAAPATVTLTFPPGSGLQVNLVDKVVPSRQITDYRWIIEEDRTFWIDPKCQVNQQSGTTRPLDSYGRTCPNLPVEALGYNFHTASMPVVATGCVGSMSCESKQTLLGVPAVCDVGNGICRTTDAAGAPLANAQRTELKPSDVYLDPNKHYFISVMPGDGINPTLAGAGGPVSFTKKDGSAGTRLFDPAVDCPADTDFTPGSGQCGHNMGGAQIAPQFDVSGNKVTPSVTINLAQTPLPTAKIAVLVYEDDYPLNGENDAGGGVDILAPNEAGLGGFQIELLDQAGGLGDNTGQITYDMFNMPVSNALAGTPDPANNNMDACPLTSNPDNIAGKIVTCPTYEADGKTMSPLAGQAVIQNLYPGLYEIQAFPAADRIARGEEWLQTNTLDGGKPHEAFIRPGEPAYFQEFGPGGFHVQIGFANPKIINDRLTNHAGTGICDPPVKDRNGNITGGGGGLICHSSINGHVHGNHMSRTPDERTYDTGTYDAFSFSQCYVSLGIPDMQDFAFAKCDADGNFTMTGLPAGTYKLAVFDQWNDIMLDGLITAVTVNGSATDPNVMPPPTEVTVTATQWRTNLYTRTYLDLNGNGIPDRDANGNDLEPGATLIPILIRYRDGSIGFRNGTDLNGYATYNEVFPFMNWLVVEPDQTRYKPTGQHVIYDAGGPDAPDCSSAAVGCSNAAAHLAGTVELNSLPLELRVPGAVYCSDADCTDPKDSIALGTYYSNTDTSNNAGNIHGLSSGRIDPPWHSEGWQGLLGQHSFIDFGMKPFKAATAAQPAVPATSTTPGQPAQPAQPAENGGIQGLVVYASTRPFDDPSLDVQLQWEPAVPNVQVNLYQEGTAADGTTTLTLVDTTLTSSWDKWAQGFQTNADGTLRKLADGSYVPNMNCPGQDPTSGFFATLQGSKMWLDTADTGGTKKSLAYNSQFKCFDGWSMLNQIVPAPYDGKYTFPSTVALDYHTGRPAGTGSLNGVANTTTNGFTGLAGTNCTICIANPDDGTPMLPAGKYVVEVVMPAGFEVVKEEDKNILMGDIYVAPVTQQFAGLGNVFILPDQAALNAYYNANNPLNPTTNLGVVNPREDFASTDQMWPCVGKTRIVPDTMSLFPAVGQTAPFAGASRPLCDRKEVSLTDQMGVSARFYVFTKNHIAGHFVGGMTNDMASEFDPFSPQFGEKFGVPNLPIRMRDFVGDEVTRVYGDQWGAYNGLYFSSWEVNPPNPTGYAPQMSVACMNDPGPILDTDPKSPTHGQMITDPNYNPAYSNFCYETPFMPGFTAYMDTPVTPVQAFADHYNLPDAEYPDGTPVIKRVDGDGVGPWIAGIQGAVASVSVTQGGSGYTSAPTVSITGSGGTGATATANLVSSVTSVAVTKGGSGFTTAPTVVFSGGGGSGATGTAAIKTGVTSVRITNNGGAYGGTPTVNFSGGGGSGAAGIANMARVRGRRYVESVTITHPGSGYTSAPTVTFTGGDPNGNNTRAAGTAIVSGFVTSVSVTNGGSGYSSAPGVSFTGHGSGATATAAMIGSVSSVTLTGGGSGYSSAPSVSFSGGGGIGAAGTAAIEAAGALKITAFGDRTVQNPQFAGPSATTYPYTAKTITRHYGFGAQPSTCPTTGSCPNVTVGGVPLTNVTWSDASITGAVPAGVPPCPQQQLGQEPANCGELVITAGNGKQSIDAITVTIGGKPPTVITPASASSTLFGEFYPNPLQTAIDNATPGDLLIVDAGSYRENLILWKPLRLQGVGAGSVTLNADAQPAGKMDAWRRRVSCLFGLTIQGVPNPGNGNYDSSGLFGCPDSMYFRADRIPFEGFVGWDAASNGNLAQVLQEPSLMGAYEGAGITVAGRGVNQSGSAAPADLWGQGGGSGIYPDGTRYLNNTTDCQTYLSAASNVDDYTTSNFLCNPSSIDGLSILNSSQGGGGIFLHGWSHNLQIANNRISANAGTLAGGINLGTGEVPDAFTLDNNVCGNTPATPAPLCPPIPPGTELNQAIPFQFNVNVHVHHNQIMDNASIGDALFSGTPTGGGGVTISSGSDYYQLDHNWIAANLTSGDGGGVAQVGLSFGGKINNNYVLFNQANNPTLPVDGGGIIITGAQMDRTFANGQECGNSAADLDCPPGMGEGAGPNLQIDSNLILGNSAEDGSGGGLRLRQTNGTEVAAFLSDPAKWYGITVTNNIIVNNVAGWDGGGVSLQDSFETVFVNNTVASNDTTASAGVLFKTLGAIDASSPPPGCIPQPDPTLPQDPSCTSQSADHYQQPAGLVTMQNTPNMMAQFTGDVTCPAGYGYGNAGDSLASRKNGRCLLVSLPQIANDLFWQNRSFHVEITDTAGSATNSGLQSNQNIVTLEPTLNQSYTGQCTAPASGPLYWDVGVRMDTWPANAAIPSRNLFFSQATVGTTYGTKAGTIPNVDVGQIALTAKNSILSDAANASNVLSVTGFPNRVPGAATIGLIGQYCNGARIPPEQCTSDSQGANSPYMCKGYFAPAGQSETVGVAPVFTFNNIQASATVDEGNNWINMTYGPLSLSRPPAGSAGSSPSAEPTVASAAVGAAQGAYSITATSAAVGGGTTNVTGVPGHDFYGQTRPPTSISIGAVEVVAPAPTLTSIAPNTGSRGYVVPVTLTGTHLAGTTAVNVSGTGVAVSGVTVVDDNTVTATFTISSGATRSPRNVTVTAPGGTSNAVTFTVTSPPVPTLTSIAPVSGLRGTSVPVTLTGTGLTNATGVNVSGTGVTVSGVTVVNDTTVTATFTIANGANTSARNVTITTPGGTSNAVTFTVAAPPAPTLTSINPTSGVRGATVPVTLNGANLTGATAVAVSGTGVTVSGVTVVNDTTVTATFTITTGANLSARNVTITTPNGTSPAVTFTVNGATLASIAPTSGAHNTTVPVTLTGANLTGATAVNVPGGGVTVTGLSVVNSTTVTANFVIANGATRSGRSVTVTTPIGTTNAVTFTVN